MNLHIDQTVPNWIAEAFAREAGTYTLSGGSRCTLYRSTNERLPYFAEVVVCGRYPEKGNVAVNMNRVEEISVVSGRIEVTVDDITTKLSENQSVIVKNGQRYALEGEATVLVLVLDGEAPSSTIQKVTD